MSTGRPRDYDDRGPAPGQTRQRDPEPRFEILDPRGVNLPHVPLTSPEHLDRAMNVALGHGFNVLQALTSFAFVPRNYAVALRIVQFPMTGPWVSGYGDNRRVTDRPTSGKCSNGTWYRTDNGGTFALHKGPLRQLASLLGVTLRTERVDNGEQSHWEYRAFARGRNLDGQWREIPGSKEIDLRDGSNEIAAMIAQSRNGHPTARITNARANGQRVCEEKAINAAIRNYFGLQGLTEEKAGLPFVIPTLIYDAPDDPQVRLLQAAVELGVVGQVFGPATIGKVLAPAGAVLEHAPMDPPDREPTPPPRPREEARQIPQDAPRQEAPPREREREPVRQQAPQEPRREERRDDQRRDQRRDDRGRDDRYRDDPRGPNPGDYGWDDPD